MGGGGVHGGLGGWRVHRVGAYTHPPMNSYNVKIFNFMNTHPPTHQTYPKFHSVTIHILWRVHVVGAHTHPPMNSYNVSRFNFINTHPSNISKVSLLLYIYSPTHEQLCHNISFYEHTPNHLPPHEPSKVYV